MLLLKAKTVPTCRNPLRKDRSKLSRRRHSCSYRSMDALVSTPPRPRAHGRRRAHLTVTSVPGGAIGRRQHAAGKGPIGGRRTVVSLADIIGICDAIQF